MLFSIISIITIIANALIGVAVFSRAPQDRNNQKFAFLSLSIIGWVGTLFLYYTLHYYSAVLFFGRLNFFFAAFIPVAMFEFVITFPKKVVSIPKWLEGGVIVHAILMGIASLTPLIDAREIIRNGQHVAVYGPLYIFYLLSLVGVSLCSIGILIRKLAKSSLTIRIQLQFLLLAFAGFIAVVALCNGILPYFFKITFFDPFGVLGTVIFLGFIFYAMVRHRFMDINRIAAGTGVYASAITFLGVVYFIFAFVIGETFFPHKVSIRYILLTVLSILLFKYGTSPVRKFFWQVTNKFFYNNIYDKEELFNAISEAVVSSPYLHVLIENTLKIFLDKFLITYAALIGIEDKTYVVHANSLSGPKPYLRKGDLYMLEGIQKITQVNEVEHKALRQSLQKKDIQLIVPIDFGKKRKGFFCLGGKKSGAPYSDYDIQTLELILPTISIALQNAIAIEKIKGFNKELRREVDKATKNLRLANDRLRSADKLKDEFISVASHELKTPTTAIQGFLWLVLQKDKQMTPYTREKLEKVTQLTHHITNLVNDMLDVSKIESKRISLHPEPFDVYGLAEEIKGELAVFAVEKNILVHMRGGRRYTVYADKGRARQIFSNLLHNALKYTPEGGRVSVGFKKVDHKVEVEVSDTGIGIRKPDIPKLFTKFGKLEDGNSVSSHLPGSGLGLYITKNFVELSGGEIEVMSTYGKGSTFTFSIPAPK